MDKEIIDVDNPEIELVKHVHVVPHGDDVVSEDFEAFEKMEHIQNIIAEHCRCPIRRFKRSGPNALSASRTLKEITKMIAEHDEEKKRCKIAGNSALAKDPTDISDEGP